MSSRGRQRRSSGSAPAESPRHRTERGTIAVIVDGDGTPRVYTDSESLSSCSILVVHPSAPNGALRLIQWPDGMLQHAVVSRQTPATDPGVISVFERAALCAATVQEATSATRRYRWRRYPLRLKGSGLALWSDVRSGRLAFTQDGERRPENRDTLGVCWINFASGVRIERYADLGVGSAAYISIINDSHGIGSLQPIHVTDALTFASHFSLQLVAANGRDRYTLLPRRSASTAGVVCASGSGLQLRRSPGAPNLLYLDDCVLVACFEDEAFSIAVLRMLEERIGEVRNLWDEHASTVGLRSQRIFEYITDVRRRVRAGARVAEAKGRASPD